MLCWIGLQKSGLRGEKDIPSCRGGLRFAAVSRRQRNQSSPRQHFFDPAPAFPQRQRARRENRSPTNQQSVFAIPPSGISVRPEHMAAQRSFPVGSRGAMAKPRQASKEFYQQASQWINISLTRTRICFSSPDTRRSVSATFWQKSGERSDSNFPSFSSS